MADNTPASAAHRAAEAIRDLNHATLPGIRGDKDWKYPADAYSTVGGLAQMAMMLPQALMQVRSLVQALASSGNLRSDMGTLDRDLEATLGGLGDAEAAARHLYEALNRAQSGLGPIAYKD